jgi:hypothetical protein
MNKPNSPWSIKAVSIEAREAAKEGARISHQPLGKWLSEVIHKTSAAEAGQSMGDTATLGDTVARAAATAPPSNAATWQEAVVRLESRIAAAEQRATAAVEPLHGALEKIVTRLDSIETYVLRRPRRSYLTRLLRR